MKLVETPDPKWASGGCAGSPPAHVVPDTARRRAGTYGSRAAPAVELRNSNTVLPLTEDAKMPAYRMEGGGGVLNRTTQHWYTAALPESPPPPDHELVGLQNSAG